MAEVIERGRESKRQRRGGQQGKVLYVATYYRLLGIDLDDIEPGSRSYKVGSGVFPIPNFIVNLEFKNNNLPIASGVFAGDDDSVLYFVGGERFNEDVLNWDTYRDYDPNDPEQISSKIHRFDTCDGSLVHVGSTLAGKGRPFVERFAAGKIYVLGRRAMFVNYVCGDCPEPMFELLHLSSFSGGDHVEPIVLNDLVFRRDIYPLFITDHFVIANRLFIVVWDSLQDKKLSIACFDTAAGGDGLGRWVDKTIINSNDIFHSFHPVGGISACLKCVSVYGVDDKWSGLHVLLLCMVYPFENPDYFAGICNEYGILFCYQDITAQIFNELMVPENIGSYTCQFVDMGGGRVYAVTTGLTADGPDGDTRTVLCVSDFTIRKLSNADQILSKFLVPSVICPAKEEKFVDIDCVKNYICEIPNDTMHDVTGAFVF